MEVGVRDISFAEGRVNVTLTNEAQLSEREQRVYHGLHTPTLRQARRGVRPLLPRITFSSHQISFGYTKGEAGDLLKKLTDLLGQLRHREQERQRPRPTPALRPTHPVAH
jgi:hypothetical protein